MGFSNQKTCMSWQAKFAQKSNFTFNRNAWETQLQHTSLSSSVKLKADFSCQWFLTQEIVGKQSCSWPPVALPRSLCQMFALSLQHKQSKEVPEHCYLQYTLSNAKKMCVSLASCAACPCW